MVEHDVDASRSGDMTDAACAPDCPICGGAGRVWTRRFGRELRRCRSCGFAWVPEGLMLAPSGRSIYEDDTPIFMTDQQVDYYRDESTLDAAQDKLEWVRAHTRGAKTLLDVGANFGYFVKEASAWFDAVGIEPSPRVVEWARTHLGAPLEVGSIYDRRPDFRGRFDVITMFDVIEHLPDPRAALERCREYLTPDGRLFITTPDSGSPMARALGSQWYYVDLVEHISLFNATSLRRLLADAGFAVVATRTIGRRYRFSYIERRLRQLSAETLLLRAAHAVSLPLRLWPNARVRLNLGDVTGVLARLRSSSFGEASP